MVLRREPCRSLGNEVSAAIYRLLSNERLDGKEILRVHREAAIRRMMRSGGTIPAVQETTSLNYNTHEKMEGIGHIGGKTLGVNIHCCLAVTAKGLALGIPDQTSYNRIQPKDESLSHDSKKTRPLEEKESYRRDQTLWESTSGLP
jgi:hypothetical protein